MDIHPPLYTLTTHHKVQSVIDSAHQSSVGGGLPFSYPFVPSVHVSSAIARSLHSLVPSCDL